MDIIVIIVCVLVFIFTRSDIADLREKIEELQDELARLKYGEMPSSAPQPFVAENVTPDYKTDSFESAQPTSPASSQVVAEDWADDFNDAAPQTYTKPQVQTATRIQEPAEPRTFEQQFGGQAFVWLGGIALALAGFFMVKYSIESGLLTEKIRVVLGITFGFALLYGSHIVRQHSRIADGERISQALAGAGIADLYGCFFAATTLYHLVPPWFGFSCMAIVTVLTLVMSLRYGAPIAALGLIGGFATPILIHGDANSPLLFGYLYLVFGGLSVVIRRQNWWWLSIPATLVAFLWVILWICNGMAQNDGAWLSLFLLGICATVVATTRGVSDEKDPSGLPACFRYAAIGGSLLLMASVTYTAHFGAFEWDMFGLFSVGAIILAWFDNRTYGFAPWLAMGANAVMLLGWEYVEPTTLAITIMIFGLLFTSSAYLLMGRSKNPTPWALLSAASALIYYLLAYHKLDTTLALTLQVDHMLSAHELWAALGFVFAGLFAAATYHLFMTQSDIKLRHKQQAIFTLAATSFLSLAFAILLYQEFLAFAIAAQILTLSWMSRRVDIPALRSVAQALMVVFGLLLLPELFDLLNASFEDFAKYGRQSLDKFHTAPSLLFQFGLPSLMFAGSSWLLREESDDEFVAALELASIALFSIMSYNLIGTFLNSHETAFVARGLFTNILLLLSFGALRVSRAHAREAIKWGGLVLGSLAIARIVGFDLLLDNPLWSHQFVGQLPVLNGLLLAYGLPALLILVIKNELENLGNIELVMPSKIAACILAFVFISMNVRQFYHGAYLYHNDVTNAEVYTYSVAWLLMGVGLLVGGVVRQDSMMRLASLLIMLLTVGKAFLYDASELTGLLRVLSFFGLGVSLLGLSWFYSKFVFNAKKQKV